MFDLDAYLARIGLSGRPSLTEIHAAHATSIPFDGFDSYMGQTPCLGADELAEKLVVKRRGGYCYEQNLLLKAALQELGYQVEPYLARVMIGLAPGAVRPPTHLLLRVRGGPEGRRPEDPNADRAEASAGAEERAGTPTSASAAARCWPRCRGGRGPSTSRPVGAFAASSARRSGSCRRSTGASGSTSTASCRSPSRRSTSR